MTILSEDEMMVELYKRLGADGWSADSDLSIVGIISDSKTFLKENAALKFTAMGEFVGVRLQVESVEAFSLHGATPRRVNAALDVLGVLPSSDEWMAWYRESIWGTEEGGNIPPSE